MANFQYIARNVKGEQVTGVLQADSEAGVVRLLDEKKLFPVRVSIAKESGGAMASLPMLGHASVRTRDVAGFYGQLADLLRAGVPMMRAMETLARAGANKRLAQLVKEAKDAVAQGDALADALAKNTAVFPTLHVAMIRAGERGGFLEDVLANLSSYLEKQDELLGKLRGAMIYPAILTFAGSGVIIFMLLVLVPQFKPIFEGVSLPLPTVILFAASDAFVSQWPVLIAVTFVAVLAVVSFFRSEAGRRKWDIWRMRVPVMGGAIRMTCIARFCRILGTMLANGVPLLQALSISRDAAGSIMLATNIEQAAESVRAGQSLSQPLRAGGMFPEEVIEMVAVAEESNQLEKVLVQIADTVERRTNQKIDYAVRLIEPLILVALAGVIGFVALGLLVPIFSMSQTMK